MRIRTGVKALCAIFGAYAGLNGVDTPDIVAAFKDRMLEHGAQRIAENPNDRPFCIKTTAKSGLNARQLPGIEFTVDQTLPYGHVTETLDSAIDSKGDTWYMIPGELYVNKMYTESSSDCPGMWSLSRLNAFLSL